MSTAPRTTRLARRRAQQSGPFFFRHRTWTIVLWVLLVAAMAPLAAKVTHDLTSSGFSNPTSSAVWADNQAARMPGAAPTIFLAERVNPTQAAADLTSVRMQRAVTHRVGTIGTLIFTPPGVSTAGLSAKVSAQGGTLLPVDPKEMGTQIDQNISATLRQSSTIAIPLLVILLLLVYGSVAAAFLPLVIALAGGLVGLAAVDLLETHITLSIYLTDIVSFLALGVGIDYALFISTRFRRALERPGASVSDAVAESMRTSGRSVAYSGLAVALAVATLLLGGDAYWQGLAVGGAVTVLAVLLATHSLLPAILSVVGRRINWGRLPRIGRGGRFWPAIADFATRRRALAVPLGLAILIGLGIFGPSLNMRTEANPASLLPVASPLAQASVVEQQVLGQGAVAPLLVVLRLATPTTAATTWQTVATVTTNLGQMAGVASVESPTSQLSPAQLAALYARPALVPTALHQTLSRFSDFQKTPHTVLLVVVPRTGPDAALTRQLAQRMATALPRWVPSSTRTGVGGLVPLLNSFTQLTAQRLPWVLAAVAVVTLLVLGWATGSLVQAALGLGLSALVALATAGVLVLTVQRGGFGLTPGPVDAAITPLIFALLFGLSMDYEVILLHRMQEHLAAGEKPVQAAKSGLIGTGAMITGAGLVMAVAFAVLLASQLEVMKTMAIGLTTAILLDTWVVRSLLVPGISASLGKVAFWPWKPPAGRQPDPS
ncbi:MAG: MMPL family transporter [Sulfobacillus sp.]